MRLPATTLLLLLTACSNQHVPVAADRWHQLEAESNRLTATFRGAIWERRMLSAHNVFWPQIYQACAAEPRKDGIESFRAIAVINSKGFVTEFLVNPENKALACFTRHMVGRKYPAPPKAPFYEVYTVNLSSM